MSYGYQQGLDGTKQRILTFPHTAHKHTYWSHVCAALNYQDAHSDSLATCYPVPLLPQVLSTTNQTLPPSGAPLVLLNATSMTTAAPDPRARQFEVRLSFTVGPLPGGALGVPPAGRANFTVGARLLLGQSSHVDIVLQGVADAAAAGTPQTGQQEQPQGQQQQQQRWMRVVNLSVAVDKTQAGGFTPAVTENGPVPLPVVLPVGSASSGGSADWWLPGRPLTLDVFVDHSVVEVYAMRGLARVTSRIYPADETSSWGLGVMGSVSGAGMAMLGSAELWSLDNAWATTQPPLC